MLMQVAPGNAGSRNPENPIQNKAMISRTAPAPRTALDHEGLKTGPFLVAHQSPDQDSLPKSHLESDTRPLGNPLCQHFLDVNYLKKQLVILHNKINICRKKSRYFLFLYRTIFLPMLIMIHDSINKPI